MVRVAGALFLPVILKKGVCDMLRNNIYTVNDNDNAKIYTMLELVEKLTKLLETQHIEEFLQTLAAIQAQINTINANIEKLQNAQANQSEQINAVNESLQDVNNNINITNQELEHVVKSLGVIDGGLTDIIG